MRLFVEWCVCQKCDYRNRDPDDAYRHYRDNGRMVKLDDGSEAFASDHGYTTKKEFILLYYLRGGDKRSEKTAKD